MSTSTSVDILISMNNTSIPTPSFDTVVANVKAALRSAKGQGIFGTPSAALDAAVRPYSGAFFSYEETKALADMALAKARREIEVEAAHAAIFAA